MSHQLFIVGVIFHTRKNTMRQHCYIKKAITFLEVFQTPEALILGRPQPSVVLKMHQRSAEGRY